MAEKEVKRRRSRYESVYPKASVIKVLVPENPKMKGTKAFEKWKAYEGSRTVGEYLKNGGSYQNLVEDIGRNFVRVTVIH